LLLLVAYLPLAARSYGWSWHAGGLVIITVLGGAPAVGGMYGIRLATNATLALNPKGAQVVVLIALRQLLQRLLAAVGSLVALSTLALGAGLAMRRQLPPGVRVGGITGLPPEAVVVFGAVGSTLVALVYGPVAAALRRRGEDLCDQLFPSARPASQPTSLIRPRTGRSWRNCSERTGGWLPSCRAAWPFSAPCWPARPRPSSLTDQNTGSIGK